MFDRLIERMGKSFHSKQYNLGYPSLLETIGKYSFLLIIGVSLIAAIVCYLRG